MADETSKVPPSFDVKTIRALVELMSRHDLNVLDLRNGDQRICLRRGGTIRAASPGVMIAAPEPAPVPMTPAAPAAAKPANEKPAKALHEIKSPTPGTFYAAASPDAPPFVKAGARVTPTSVVCVIEAMKIFNEITAECAGVVTEVLVENQQAVEYGQVLFRVDPAG